MVAREKLSIDMGRLLNLPDTGATVTVWTAGTDATPEQDRGYIVPAWGVHVIKFYAAICAGNSDNLWLSGPTGCGKTAMIRWLASTVKASLYEVTGSARLEFPDLVGQWVMSGPDGMTWSDGPLTRAMREGAWLLINEADICEPGMLAGLNTVLDGGALTIPEHGSEVVRPADGFLVIVTANTNGGGDDTGLYMSTVRQNLALMDRFTVINADYLAPEVEDLILSTRVPGLPESLRSIIIRVANDVRSLFKGDVVEGASGALDVTMSTRTLIRWARGTLSYAKSKRTPPLVMALELALLNRASRASAQTIREILQRYINA